MTGRLLELTRLSVHDGPGIRTTVFLKGCSLRCRWCHNPESISPKPEIGLVKRKCLGCGDCAEVCPAGAHSFSDGVHHLNRDLCQACGRCVQACLMGALEYFGGEMTAEEVATAAMEDATFYAISGGGCTISGGEPLLQAPFCAEVFGILRQSGIHCALDTSGAVPWECFEKVLPHTDLFLYDVKHVDEDLHREYTGSSCSRIAANLTRLGQCGIPIEVRIPTIPGFNADPDSMAAIGQFLSGLDNIVGVRLLPYHLARSKYETIGRPYPMDDVQPPDTATIDNVKTILQGYGLLVI
ncbi:MAG: glycyl-radical enzyme activating protein [Armatimonadia bacterium]